MSESLSPHPKVTVSLGKYTGPSNGPWQEGHILSTKSFPSTSILRYGSPRTHTCTCEESDLHRGLLDYLRVVVTRDLVSGTDTIPATKVCWNAENLWECKLPRKLTSLNSRLGIYDLPSMWHVQKVLMEGTYWFPRLMGKKDGQRNSVHGKAILRMASGLTSYTGKEEVWQLVKRKPSREGLNKLRQVLATVDGLLMQMTLCMFDTEFLTWNRLDQVTNSMICQLIPDYFRKEDSNVLSTFEKVKKLRKAIKETGFNPSKTPREIVVPQELSFFQAIINSIGDCETPITIDRIMILSQTRASGVPPRTVFFKTMKKLREVLTTPPDPTVYNNCRYYVDRAIDQLHDDVCRSIGEERRSKIFSKIVEAAKVSMSDSGEFFTKSNEGGKIEAARKVLEGNPRIKEINLHTGRETGKVLSKDNTNVGNLLFHWACGLFQDRSRIYERNLMSVRVSLVAELGKYRGITVSHLAHSVLLHIASHCLLEYLRQIPSDGSGVGAANHAWNFFQSISHKNPAAAFIFGDKDSYVFSSDWEDATNYCDHTVAQAIINRLMDNLGFPAWYRQTVCFALCAPRQVEFLDEDKILDVYYTTRGVLMGDPVTKVVLHCYHHVAEFAARHALLTRR
jgi:hypothetical protein